MKMKAVRKYFNRIGSEITEKNQEFVNGVEELIEDFCDKQKDAAAFITEGWSFTDYLANPDFQADFNELVKKMFVIDPITTRHVVVSCKDIADPLDYLMEIWKPNQDVWSIEIPFRKMFALIKQESARIRLKGAEATQCEEACSRLDNALDEITAAHSPEFIAEFIRNYVWLNLADCPSVKFCNYTRLIRSDGTEIKEKPLIDDFYVSI
jgi:hypothetical protein